MTRWLLTLSEYKWSIKYREGNQNRTLSRMSSAHLGREEDGTDRLEDLLRPISNQTPVQTESSKIFAAVGFTPSWTGEELQMI